MLFLLSACIFQNQPFSKILSGISSDCQKIQIGPNFLSDLIVVQNCCKGYQQMTLARKELRLILSAACNSASNLKGQKVLSQNHY